MNGCVNCGEQLPEGARFCPACGAEQTAPTCATCGAALLPGARFCFSCGTPVPDAHRGRDRPGHASPARWPHDG